MKISSFYESTYVTNLKVIITVEKANENFCVLLLISSINVFFVVFFVSDSKVISDDLIRLGNIRKSLMTKTSAFIVFPYSLVSFTSLAALLLRSIPTSSFIRKSLHKSSFLVVNTLVTIDKMLYEVRK